MGLAAALDDPLPAELQTVVVGNAALIREPLGELGVGDFHVHDS